MSAVFKELIKPFFELICRPLPSMPDKYNNMYKMKRPLILYDLVQKLDKYKYKIEKLVMNFNNKIIGVMAKEPGLSERNGFVPCYPSALNDNLKKKLDFVFMTDLSLWNTYENTLIFLNNLYKRSKKRMSKTTDIDTDKKKAEQDTEENTGAIIECKPVFKVIENELIVGILTNTNQFIQISVPITRDEVEEIETKLINQKKQFIIPKELNDSDYLVSSKKNEPSIASDAVITTHDDVDTERESYIKKIKLETSFYNIFRNTIRILINDYENIKIREKIEHEMTNNYITYSNKLANINKLLRELVKDKIQFTGDENFYKKINEVSTCIVKDQNKCKNAPNLCIVTDDGNCNLILPEKNLLRNKKNETIYFGRMADELIRYNRIKSFMLQPQIYLSFGNISYNLRENEVILIQSTLTQEYFDTLIPAIMNKYTNFNSYDETEPIITQTYDNKISSLDEAIGRKNEGECHKTTNNHITSGFWKKCFPSNYNEIEYSKYNFCTFNFIIDIIEKKTGEKFEQNEIKRQLYEEYSKYIHNINKRETETDESEKGEHEKDERELHRFLAKTPSTKINRHNRTKILDILIREGKKNLGDQVIAGSLSFLDFIYTDSYFLTPFDLWLLLIKYKIPSIFISQKCLLQTDYKYHEFLCYGNKDDKFAFIVVPGLRNKNVPGYKIIQSDEKDIFISLDNLNQDYDENIHRVFDNKITVEDYIEKYTKLVKTQYKKKCEKLNQPIKKHSKSRLIIEETSSISPEKYIIKQPKKETKKVIVRKGQPQNKTKRRTGIKKRRVLIADSD
jgi:hypothetical protein